MYWTLSSTTISLFNEYRCGGIGNTCSGYSELQAKYSSRIFSYLENRISNFSSRRIPRRLSREAYYCPPIYRGIWIDEHRKLSSNSRAESQRNKKILPHRRIIVFPPAFRRSVRSLLSVSLLIIHTHTPAHYQPFASGSGTPAIVFLSSFYFYFSDFSYVTRYRRAYDSTRFRASSASETRSFHFAFNRVRPEKK